MCSMAYLDYLGHPQCHVAGAITNSTRPHGCRSPLQEWQQRNVHEPRTLYRIWSDSRVANCAKPCNVFSCTVDTAISQTIDRQIPSIHNACTVAAIGCKFIDLARSGRRLGLQQIRRTVPKCLRGASLASANIGAGFAKEYSRDAWTGSALRAYRR